MARLSKSLQLPLSNDVSEVLEAVRYMEGAPVCKSCPVCVVCGMERWCVHPVRPRPVLVANSLLASRLSDCPRRPMDVVQVVMYS